MTSVLVASLSEIPLFNDPLYRRGILILVIIGAGILANHLIQNQLQSFLDRFKISTLPLKPVKTLIRWVVFLLVATIVINAATGHDLITFVTGAFAMVAIGFVAGWSVISNFFCALLILVFKPFEIGETITVVGEGIKGKVVDLTLLYTTLEDEDHSLHQIPNNLFFQRIISRQRMKKPPVSLQEQFRKEEPYHDNESKS